MAIERWDERYSARDYLWDIGPNEFVEQELADLEPGTAVDLAAGEGRNAVCLAIDHGVADRVEVVEADALTYEPAEPVDLVVISYLQIPVEEQRIALEHAATWLRPGGTILVVAHDRTNVEHGHGGPSDPDHCYELDATVAILEGLDITTADIVEREVDIDAGPRTALDTLVIATAPLD